MNFVFDKDKVPDTPISSMTLFGVEVQSRYQKHDEYAVLVRLVSALPISLRNCISKIECDSKATWVLTVTMRLGLDHAVHTVPIGAVLDAMMVELIGGHNGINVGDTADFDARWLNDELR